MAPTVVILENWRRLTRLGFVLSELECIDVVSKEERWCFVDLEGIAPSRILLDLWHKLSAGNRKTIS